jgi:hypothetical protein
MNSPNGQKFEAKLRELESQVGEKLRFTANSQTGQSLQTLYHQFLTWFKALPNAGKIIVFVLGGIISLSLVKTTLELITFSVSILIIGGLLFLGYKLWIAPNSKN